ncbi:hypothetical protein STEG23_035530 [Scotinomys teguina]
MRGLWGEDARPESSPSCEEGKCNCADGLETLVIPNAPHLLVLPILPAGLLTNQHFIYQPIRATHSIQNDIPQHLGPLQDHILKDQNLKYRHTNYEEPQVGVSPKRGLFSQVREGSLIQVHGYTQHLHAALAMLMASTPACCAGHAHGFPCSVISQMLFLISQASDQMTSWVVSSNLIR